MNCELLSKGFYLGNGLPEDKVRIEQLGQAAQEWQLLLQLDTDERAEMLWGIDGRCYYWIRKEALEKLQFEDTWFIMQWA